MAVSYEKIYAKALQLREEYRQLLTGAVQPAPTIDSYREIDLNLVGDCITRLLIYTPERGSSAPLPVYITLHSGAFVRGSAYFDDYINRLTANRVGCIVVAVEFQLAPEFAFPVQLEECYAAAKWVCENALELGADPTRIAIGGHNSGGTIAAAVCLMVRDRAEFTLCAAVLDCAMFTLLSAHGELPDFEPDDPMKGPIRGTFFNTCYLRELELGQTNQLASPLYAESVERLPPTLVIVAGLDAARADAEAYYQRLLQAGNGCRFVLHEGMPHGFNVQPGLASRELVDASFLLIDEYLMERFSL